MNFGFQQENVRELDLKLKRKELDLQAAEHLVFSGEGVEARQTDLGKHLDPIGTMLFSPGRLQPLPPLRFFHGFFHHQIGLYMDSRLPLHCVMGVGKEAKTVLAD